MKLFRYLLCAALGCLAPRLMAAGPAPLSETLKSTQVVAYIRVTHVEEELRDNLVYRTATLTVCGRAYRLGTQTELKVPFGVPVQADASNPEEGPRAFFVGYRCIVLLAYSDKHWQALQQLNVSADGKFQEETMGAEIGLQPGTDANAAVKLIEGVLRKNEPSPAERTIPPPPTRRDEPWNLFRASPLRRVWPFFPF